MPRIPLLILICVTVFKFVWILNDPIFFGDSGFRLEHAGQILHQNESRFWLPALDIHTWILNSLGLPAWTFKLVPLLYSSAALFLLILISVRLGFKSLNESLFVGLLVLCISFQPSWFFVSTQLYQESLEAAFFLALVYLWTFTPVNLGLAFLIMIVGIFTRESFWIYLATFCVLKWREILNNPGLRHGVLLLWALILVWYLSTIVRISGSFSVTDRAFWEGISFIDQKGQALRNISVTLESHLYSFVTGNLLFFVLALTLIYLVFRIGKILFPLDSNWQVVKKFIVLTLVLIHLLFLFGDPFTYGNIRVGFPAILLGSLLAIILYAEARGTSKYLMVLGRTVLCFGVFSVASIPKMNSEVTEVNTLREFLQQHMTACNQQIVIHSTRYWGDIQYLAYPLHGWKLQWVTGSPKVSPGGCYLIGSESAPVDTTIPTRARKLFSFGGRKFIFAKVA